MLQPLIGKLINASADRISMVEAGEDTGHDTPGFPYQAMKPITAPLPVLNVTCEEYQVIDLRNIQHAQQVVRSAEIDCDTVPS